MLSLMRSLSLSQVLELFQHLNMDTQSSTEATQATTTTEQEMPPPPPPAAVPATTSTTEPQPGPSRKRQASDSNNNLDDKTRQMILEAKSSTLTRELPLITRNTILTSMLDALIACKAEYPRDRPSTPVTKEFMRSVHQLGYMAIYRTNKVVCVCCPFGQVLIYSPRDFDRNYEMQLLMKDLYIIKIWANFVESKLGPNAAPVNAVFTGLDSVLDEVDFFPKEAKTENFRPNAPTTCKVLKGLVYAIALKATKFTNEDNFNLSPQIRYEVLSLAAEPYRKGTYTDPAAPTFISTVAQTLRDDPYFTHVRNLTLSGGNELRNKLQLTQLAATDLWRRKSFPVSLQLERQVHYGGPNFCRTCALPMNQHEGKTHTEEQVKASACFYPLCNDEETHSVATCNAIMQVCDICQRRGHNASHHDDHSVVDLEAMFLIFFNYNFKTSLLTVIQDTVKIKVPYKTKLEAWRTTLYQGRQSAKMAKILGFDNPNLDPPVHKSEKKPRVVEPGSKQDYFRLAFREHQKAAKAARTIHRKRVVTSENHGRDARGIIQARLQNPKKTETASVVIPFQSPRHAVINQMPVQGPALLAPPSTPEIQMDQTAVLTPVKVVHPPEVPASHMSTPMAPTDSQADTVNMELDDSLEGIAELFA